MEGQRESGSTDAEREPAATEPGEGISMEEAEGQRESGSTDAGREPAAKEPWVSGTISMVIKIAVGVWAVVATPMVTAALGFGTGGIAAGSMAAKGMSLASKYGFGMSVISTLQSIGALATLTISQMVAVGTTVTAASAAVCKFVGWLWKK